MKKPEFKEFARYIISSESVKTFSQRVLAFLYFRTKFRNGKASIAQLIFDFKTAGLGKPQLSRLRDVLTRDKRTRRVGNGAWMIPADKFVDFETEFELTGYLRKDNKNISLKKVSQNNLFVDDNRLKELGSLNTKDYDFSRLIKMCEEINDNFLRKNFISVIFLIRAVINHVAPLFGFNSFGEVANNYKCEKSLKESFQHLENSSRKIADGYSHIKIRQKESLPNATQINFSQDLDVLLGEIVRLYKN